MRQQKFIQTYSQLIIYGQMKLWHAIMDVVFVPRMFMMRSKCDNIFLNRPDALFRNDNTISELKTFLYLQKNIPYFFWSHNSECVLKHRNNGNCVNWSLVYLLFFQVKLCDSSFGHKSHTQKMLFFTKKSPSMSINARSPDD